MIRFDKHGTASPKFLGGGVRRKALQRGLDQATTTLQLRKEPAQRWSPAPQSSVGCNYVTHGDRLVAPDPIQYAVRARQVRPQPEYRPLGAHCVEQR
jgi:hypothetical protein